jgi:predicted DNA-binding protein YlxM (UPF0122 family)
MTESINPFKDNFLDKFVRAFTKKQKEILRVLYLNPKGLPRSKIAEMTNIARSTIYDNIFNTHNRINRDKEIIKVKEKDRNGNRGRPKKIYYLNDDL